ncbi:DUF814 domain-containing protein [Bacillus lacus]|uniref:Rqc2 homolog RqcH n=1 Tax=Metabacillus lacus TaxID=1983721 RepID=A0A7X2M0M2_9BACI|nr:NFACT RNA binding domain-containing protein [Metabacillus lacus]MRX73342.1 DUF814 domain-containing protein [Metabacillus lacus]
MSFDGLFTYTMAEELRAQLDSGRITRIHQPYKNELIFQIRAKGKNVKLLISAHPSYARMHLTEKPYDNPNEPPMFCMLLRKHLEGGIIEKIEQVDMERIIILHIRGRNEIGDIIYRKLIVEIMGRHSNIILADSEKNVILDSIKHVSPAVNRHRTVMPGQAYVLPPEQDKINPFTAEEETVIRKLDYNAGKLGRQLVDQFAGVSPLFAQEAVYRAGLANRATLPGAFVSLMRAVKDGSIQPRMQISGGKEYFYMIELQHIGGEQRVFSALSELLDRYYHGKAERDRVKQQANDLERFAANEKKKNINKIKKLEKTLGDAEKADRYQLYGELLTANMYALTKGDKEAEVINYYDEENPVINITLNPLKTPSENAQNYFQRYQKAKNSVAVVQEQIHLAEKEVVYFDNILQQLESASPKDIEEIREELMSGGYIKKKIVKGSKKNKSKTPVLEKYQSTDGTDILVGKNNIQNEYLTNKAAARDHIWLHTKDIPGSHVVIRDADPSEETILQAAHIAAYYSKAKSSGSVPVDFTAVRNVKKPSGAKPGFVIYEGQQTVFVTPDEDLVIALKAAAK